MGVDIFKSYFRVGCSPLDSKIDTSFPVSSESFILSDGNIAFHAFQKYKSNISKNGWIDRYVVNPSIKFDDLIFVIFIILLLTSLRYLLSGAHVKSGKKFPSIFYLISKYFIPVQPSKRYRFSETLTFLLWHTISFGWNLWVLQSEIGTDEDPHWLRSAIKYTSSRWFWLIRRSELTEENIGWPFVSTPQHIKIFYLTQISFWMSSTFYLFFETPRSDFAAMITHHSATCILLVLSYFFSLWKVGLIVLVLHDIVDIFLYAAKCFHYCVGYDKYADICFMFLILSYFVARLILYPIACVLPIINLRILRYDTCGGINTYWDLPGYLIFPLCLTALWVLHIYWFSLILKVALKAVHAHITTGGTKGVRSGDDISDDECYGDNEE